TDPFRSEPLGSDIVVSQATHAAPARPLTDREVREGVRAITSIPRIPSRPDSERESKVYNAPDLRDLVAMLLDEFGTLLLSDVRRILEVALTAWLPTILRDHEEDHISSDDPEQALERATMEERILTLAATFDEAQRTVLLGKSRGMSDGELASR